MPTQHGRHETIPTVDSAQAQIQSQNPNPNPNPNPNHAETALSDPLHAPEVSNLLSDVLPGLPFQVDFVEAICSSSASSSLSFPEMLGTIVNFLNGIGIIVGIIAVLGVGIIAYGFNKMSATSGGGGGKKYIVGGIFVFMGGVLAYTIPAFTEQSLDGGGACIVTDGGGGDTGTAATVMVPPEMVETVMTVATIVL